MKTLAFEFIKKEFLQHSAASVTVLSLTEVITANRPYRSGAVALTFMSYVNCMDCFGLTFPYLRTGCSGEYLDRRGMK
jgi:hypothetical protein